MRHLYVFQRCLVVMLFAGMSLSFGGSGGAQAAPPPPDRPERPSIVGGSEAQPGAWPWQVYVSPGSYQCGGSLIHAEWVLTAAHCFFDEQGNPIPTEQVSVMVGVHNLAADPAEGETIAAAEVFQHPDYAATNKVRGDVALIRLAQPATLGGAVALAKLGTPLDETLFAAGIMATVTGWGATSEGGNSSDVLLQVDLPIVSNEACSASYPDSIFDSHLCAGGVQGQDSCQGDSGGPLVVLNADQSGYIQAGVVSYGKGCAQDGVPGVYERVSSYNCWINQTTGHDLGGCGDTPPPPPPGGDFFLYLPMALK